MIWQKIYLWLPGVFTVFDFVVHVVWVYQFAHKCIFVWGKNCPWIPRALISQTLGLQWCHGVIWQKPHRWHFQTADSNAFLSRSQCLVLAENLKRMQSECVIFLHPFPMNMCMQTWLKLRYCRNNWRQLSFSHTLFL